MLYSHRQTSAVWQRQGYLLPSGLLVDQRKHDGLFHWVWKLEHIFNTVSSFQAPNSENDRKAFETLKNSLKNVDRMHLVEVKAEVTPSKFAEFSPWQLRELCFPSPGNYAAAILRQHLCSTGTPVLRVTKAEFLIGYCMLSKTLCHDFQEDILAAFCHIPEGIQETIKMDADTPGIRTKEEWKIVKDMTSAWIQLNDNNIPWNISFNSLIVNRDKLKWTTL